MSALRIYVRSSTDGHGMAYVELQIAFDDRFDELVLSW
jgi:hypothetical protein